MPTIIPVTPIPKEAEQAAVVAMRELVDSLEPTATSLASLHQKLFDALWNDNRYTREQALAALGTRAKSVLAIAAANVQFIQTIAPYLGKTLGNFLQPEDYTRPACTEHDDGTVALD